ncbi:MAG: hypothetical protein WCH35_04875 [Comamonadaceae bacterium]
MGKYFRYLSAMQRFVFFLLALFASGDAWQQSVVNRSALVAESVPEQRRAELRLALSTPQVAPAQASAQPVKIGSDVRHLSAQERADLRLQLKQQRREAKVELP